MNKKELNLIKLRWTSLQRAQGAAALVGKCASPFSIIDDLIDLRGLQIEEVIRNVKIKSVDLSGAKLEGFGQFTKCNIEKTRFQFASIQTNIGENIVSCDFSSANVAGAVLRGAFVDCDFSGANLIGVRGSEVNFSRCVFRNTKFKKAMLLHCTFEECRFEGCDFTNCSFSYSKFIASPIHEDELQDALMEKVVFI